MKAACPQTCPWGQPPGCHKDGTYDVSPKLLRAEHRVKWLSRRAAFLGKPISQDLAGLVTHYPLPGAMDSSLHSQSQLWLVPTPVQLASGCCTQ